MKPLRALALAALVGGTALVPHALPALAEPVKKTVTVMVTSIEMKNDLDIGSGCGEFSHFGMKDVNTGIVTNLIPKGAKVVAWKSYGIPFTAFSLCDSTASYPVAQTNLDALANQYDQYGEGTLFPDPQVTAANLNRYHVKATPGSTMTIAGLGYESDPVFTRYSSDTAFPVTVPAAGKSKSFSIPVNYEDPFGQSKAWAYTIRGTIITSV